MVPWGRKAGFSAGIFSGETLSGFSSEAMTVSPALLWITTGAISAAKAPSSTAVRARVRVSIA
ncbi:hypothetical protein MAE02_06260 [Microvirga aerophila]|uniref:Uncharacterized protein n=1 Tax=Microvirga aerophila TaxID=670291 RepID=A0A512BLT9_9HYPH|nr:hypothetical protein MAE02_06260 [Microvirga aerophila]